MTSPLTDPQNPYQSYVVCASAGCGKTFQLASRFLFLVGAGADPAHILTITFTKKAAAEMRERILSMSARLLNDPSFCAEFDAKLATFRKATLTSLGQRYNYTPMPPRSATATARQILASTQLLKITTIDSIFLDWYRKFPWEAGTRDQTMATANVQNPAILTGTAKKQLDKSAFELAFRDWIDGHAASDVASALQQLSVLNIERQTVELLNHTSYLWLIGQLRGEGCVSGDFLNQFTTTFREPPPTTIGELFTHISPDLTRLGAAVAEPKQRTVQQAIVEHNLDELIAQRVLTKNLTVNKSTFRAKKQEQYASEIEQIDKWSNRYLNHLKIELLRQKGQLLLGFYGQMLGHRAGLKRTLGNFEFDDIAHGCYNIFNTYAASGARYLIHKNMEHLLLDEFQDTSLLQWSIFYALAKEMLAGLSLEPKRGAPLPTLFIVGDEKQSIYGFREADPSIIKDARHTIEPLGVVGVPLNDSYRSSQIIMDFINGHFISRLEDFPHHQTASVGGKPIVPDNGMIVIAEPFLDNDDKEARPARELEANFVALWLKDAIFGDKPHLVYDKKIAGYRPLKQKDCALLYRAATHAPKYENALREAGLSVRVLEGKGFFERSEILDMLALLRFLAYPTDILSLAILLKSPLAGIKDQNMLQLLADSLSATDEGEHRFARILSWLQQHQPAVHKMLTYAMEQIYLEPTYGLLLKLCQEYEFTARYRASYGGLDGELAASNLERWLDICLRLEQSGYHTVHGMIAQLDLMRASDETGNAALAQDAISLLTIHKSKGLEFPCVVLLDAAESWLRSDPYWVKGKDQDGTMGIYYIATAEHRPDSHPDFERVMASVDNERSQENLRLLYVALTRAGQYLIVTGSAPANTKKKEGYLAELLVSAEELKAATITCHDRLCRIIDRRTSEPWLSVDNAPASAAAPLLKLTVKRSIPCEVGLLAPHRLLHRGDQLDMGADDLISPSHRRYAVQMGTFIHYGLCAHVSDKPFLAAETWQRLSGDDTHPLSSSALTEAKEQLDQVLASATFRDLLADASTIRAEQEIIHLCAGQLTRGTIDLILEKSPNIIEIIDYKTMPLTTTTATELRHICIDKGYDQQLRAYVDAMAGINPQSSITGWIYFTYNNTMVEVITR